MAGKLALMTTSMRRFQAGLAEVRELFSLAASRLKNDGDSAAVATTRLRF